MNYFRTIASLALGAVLLVSAATASEFDEVALAATNAAMAGTWSGTETLGTDTRAREIAVTIAISGENGLDQVVWARDFLLSLDYADNGYCVQQLVGMIAPVGEPELGRWIEVRNPDTNENWSRTALFANDTGSRNVRHRHVMQDGVLTIIVERKDSGRGNEFHPYWTLILTRSE